MGADAIPLRAIRVRPVRADEEARWNQLVRTHHYLGFRNLCGRRLRHVAVLGDRWLALLGWHSAALHCAARDRWIGWSHLQRRQRLFLLANNSRYVLLPAAAGVPNLASRVLGLSLRRLRTDWLARHGHDLLLAETFVDPRFAGTCYRAANWQEVGSTRGYGRVRGGAIGYQAHGVPKRVLVYPLQRDARQQLAAAEPHADWIPWRYKMQLSSAQMESLYGFLGQVHDPRKRRGRRYSLPSVLTIVIAARLAGADTLTDISDFGRDLGAATLRRIGCRPMPGSGRLTAPGISTLHYILKALDEEEVERLAGAWMAQWVPQDEPLALDGKTLRGSYDRDRGADGKLLDRPPVQQLTAVSIGSGIVAGQIGFSGKKEDAEGTALRNLLQQVGQPGRCVLADALHTQQETARTIGELGMDYVLNLKANQPTLLAQVRDDYGWGEAATTVVNCGHGRIETRTIQVSEDVSDCPEWLAFPGVRRVFRIRREAVYKKDGRERQPETAYFVTSLPAHKAGPGRLLEIVRGYWGAVENGIHYVRDVALREDACRVRKGSLPRVLAALTNVTLTILRLLRVRNLKRTMRSFYRQGWRAVAVLLG